MAQRHENFNVTAPPGTPQTGALEVATAFAPGEVDSLRVVVPDVTTSGIGIAYAHEIVIPYTSAGFILGTANTQTFAFDMDDFPVGGQWSAFVFNTGATAVIFSLHFAVNEAKPERPTVTLTPISPREIYAAGA